MARKTNIDIAEEIKKIEREEQIIEQEEKRIEEKEDLIRVMEELGLMRWKSYYILTAGAILLLALTFVTALWVMHDQLIQVQMSVDALFGELSIIEDMVEANEASPTAATVAPSSGDWCPTSGPMVLPEGYLSKDSPGLTVEIRGLETVDGREVCHGVIIPDSPLSGMERVDLYWDETGNFQMS